MKCDLCQTKIDEANSKEPACCVWYMEHVVINGENIEDCTEYTEVVKGE